MNFLLAPLALSIPLTAFPAQTINSPEPQRQEAVSLNIYTPRFGNAIELFNHLHELRAFGDASSTNAPLAQTILIRDVIGMQGTSEQCDRTRTLLHQLDDAISASMQLQPQVKPTRVADETTTIRLRSMEPNSACHVVGSLGLDLTSYPVEETGTVILKGSPSDLASAKDVLLKADGPLPQVTIRCELVEAMSTGAAQASSVHPDLAEALSAVAPGSSFVHRGLVLVRSSVGTDAVITVSTELPPRVSDGGSHSPTFNLKTRPTGWDPNERILSLRGCEVTLSIPTYEVPEIAVEAVEGVTPNHSTHKAATKANRPAFSGYMEQSFMTDLALRADETTIVGSLGGAPYFVVMHVTVD